MNTPRRLAQFFKPHNYTLAIDLDEASLSFTGTVVIRGEVLDTSFGLHARDLQITSATINGTRLTHEPANAFHEVMFSGDGVTIGEAELRISFSGTVTKAMSGLYPSTFEHEGQTKRIFATQFEAPHARELFPCIDEPSAKAIFELTLTTNAEHTVISNTLPESEARKDTRKTTQFKPTPVMSTYLLAFAVGDFHAVEAKTKKGTLVRSFASIAQPKSHLEYSVSEGVKILEFFEDYFQTPYPLEKCDHVALPDFDSGAMENWGMITYREIALLVNPDNRSVSSEQYVSMVIAHEISHQWFGNLVTMAWWDDLWLNESFASLMEHIALDAVHPDWQQWEKFAIDDIISTTSRDIYSDIQSVAVEVEDPELLSTLFDPGIVYAKGSRLIKMLRDLIGEDAFRKGLQHYFTQHAYNNATRDDLWQCFASSSQINVKELLDPWLLQPGMPVLTVDGDEHELEITQQRFLVDGSSDSTTWPVPLLSPGLSNEAMLSQTKQTFATDIAYPMINQNASGHYFVNYVNPDHQAAVRSALGRPETPPEAKINVLNDMLLLSRGGFASMIDPLKLIQTMTNESRYNVWVIISRVLNTAHQLTEGSETTRKHIANVRRSLASKQHESLGWQDQPGDAANTIQLRSFFIGMMLAGEHEPSLGHAREIVATCTSLDAIPAEIRVSVLSALVWQGDTRLANKLLKRYAGSDPEMQLDIVAALSSTRDANFAEAALNQAIGPEGFVRSQDVVRWIVRFMHRSHTRAVMWQLLRDHWDHFTEVFKNSKSFDFVPVYVSQTINSEPMAKEYKDFFDQYRSDPVLKRNIAIGIADIDARVAWRKREEAAITQWLSEQAAATE